MRALRCVLLVAASGLCLAAPSAQAMPVHVQNKLSIRQNVHLRFYAPALANGGYYYAVVVLRPYKRYTRPSPPPCSISSNMRRTDYGYPQDNGMVALALVPARSRARHWCPGGSYEGAIYAVTSAPPCQSSYDCTSESNEPYENRCLTAKSPTTVPPVPPVPCPMGVVPFARPWEYLDPLPTPRQRHTAIVGRFSVKFPAR